MKKHNCKKLVCLTGFGFLCWSQIFAASVKTDSALFGELNSAYHSGSFPGVVEYAVQMESEYPRSILMPKTLLYKGESLYRLNRYREAEEALTQCIKISADDVTSKILAFYYRGLSYFKEDNFPECQKDFYNCSALWKKSEILIQSKTYFAYENSLMFAGQSYFKNHQFLNAEKILSATVCNGVNINISDYETSFLMLSEACLENEHYENLTLLYENLKGKNLSEEANELTDNISKKTFFKLSLDAGKAYEAQKKYLKAYELYTMVLNGEDAFLASLALQNAYNVASAHKKEIGSDPGEILEKVKGNLSGYKNLLAQFWTRLAIDSYLNNDFSKAEIYFKNAAECDEEKKYLALHGLYKAYMVKKSQSENALAVLNEYYGKANVSNDNEYYADYLAAYSRFYSYCEKWDKAVECAKEGVELAKSQNKKKYVLEECAYWQSLGLYNQGKFTEALTAIEEICPLAKNMEDSSKDGLWYNANLLYSKLLFKNGREASAKKAFEIIETSILKPEDRLDYSKILFVNGFVTSSLKQSLRVESFEADYMSALSYFNKQDWVNAEKHFSKYIKSGKKENLGYAKMYSGYSLYKQKKSDEAYSLLMNFASENKNHILSFNACLTSVNAALQIKKFDLACAAADLAMECAQSEKQKEEAVVLSADVYTDAENYEKAISLLISSSERNDDFGMNALYKIAQIYERQNQYDECDKIYLDIVNKFPSNPLADEACYRRGELYYNAEKYQIAVSRFKEYQKKFRTGKFLDASYFYIADSYAKVDQLNQASLQYKFLIETSPDSAYIFNARKNLISLYKNQGNYTDAITQSDALLKQFPELSKKDGISEEKEILVKLAGGEDETYVKLQSQYFSKGASKTKAGRIAGTELCENMWGKEELKEEAAVIAGELFSIQTEEANIKAEGKYAARTGVIIAEFTRSSNDNLKSAELYLSSAKYARSDNNHNLVQRCLYGAVEAFMAAGLTEDAKISCNSLNELYPESSYAVNAAALISE